MMENHAEELVSLWSETWTVTAILLIGCFLLNFFKENIWDALTVSVQFVDDYNGNFHNIKNWIGSHLDIPRHKNSEHKDDVKRPSQGLFRVSYHVWGSFFNKTSSYGKKSQTLRGQPSPGSSFFMYKGRLFRVMLKMTPDTRYRTTSTARIRISTFKWNADALKSLLLEAMDAGVAGGKESRTTVFGLCDSFGGGWRDLGKPKLRRTVDSVLLGKGQVEKIVTDIQSFLNCRKWYEDRYIPHRRGYLLYGPPGCGKTSMVRAIAGEFKQDICSLALSSKGLTDDVLMGCLNRTPANSLILIEDVDCAFKSRQDYTASTAETNLVLAGSSGSAVTFRGLLNALDGVASCDGKIVFLTTNHPEKLDPALTRPGRVDVKVLLDYPDEEQLGRFFTRFYPEATEEVMQKFLVKVKSLDRKVSMAMVQGLFLMYKDAGQDAVDGCEAYFEEQFKILPSLNDVNANLYI